jgi:hypothetical protein
MIALTSRPPSLKHRPGPVQEAVEFLADLPPGWPGVYRPSKHECREKVARAILKILKKLGGKPPLTNCACVCEATRIAARRSYAEERPLGSKRRLTKRRGAAICTRVSGDMLNSLQGKNRVIEDWEHHLLASNSLKSKRLEELEHTF